MHLSCKKKKLTKREVLKLKEDSFAAHGLAVTFAHWIFLLSKIIKKIPAANVMAIRLYHK